MTGAGSFWFANPGQEFYNGVATQSARFNGASEHTTLWRKMGSDPSASRRKAVFSWWMKGDLEPGSPYFWTKGSGGGVADIFSLLLNGDRLQVIEYIADSNTMSVISTRLLRDPSAWYHIVWAFDSTQATDTNRVQLFVNGVKQTAFDTSSIPSQNHDHAFGYYQTGNAGSTVERIGGYQGTYTNDTGSGGGTGDANSRFNGYMAEWNYVDGLSFFSDTSGTANSSFNINSFGEFKNGVWIPVEYDGSHGNWGYRLEFKNTSVGSGTSSTVGADTSGNDHHWTSTGLVAADCNIPDSPENNFCTLNSEGRRYGHSYAGTFSEGNLKYVTAGNASGAWGTMAINQIASQGGVYFEVRLDVIDAPRCYFGLIGDTGVNNKNSNSNGAAYSFPVKVTITQTLYVDILGADTTNRIDLTASTISGNTAFSAGDVAGFAILSDGKVFIHRNGTYLKNASGNTGNPSTGANPITTIDLTEGDWMPYVGYNSSFTVNFGQDGTFNGNETPSDTYADSNGIGKFNYAVPTNCLAICTSNMAEPTIGPNSDTQSGDHFNALLYTGNGSTQSITGVGFKPDLTWSKDKDNGVRNVLTDSSRGVHLDFFSDLNSESNDTAGVTAFNADGFSLGSSTNHNVSSRIYVSWNWKANGGTTTTNDASATGVGSIDSVYQANTTAGFSIVTYTGSASSANNGTASTVAHGLGAVPKWIWFLPRDTYDGCVYHEQVATDPATDRLLLHTSSTTDSATAKSDSDEFFNDTEPTSTVFSIGTRKHVNSDGGMVAYCWAEVEGFSKFGSYIGNSSTDGPFVYLGFKPSFLMIKRSEGGTGNWIIHDDARDPTNESSRDYLYANLANAQGTDGKVDFLSNGFKQRSPSSYTSENASGSTYVYMAFAEAPFKYANAK